MKLVVFDMAGTTVHDDGLVLASFVRAVREVQLDATPEELNARMGMSKLEVFDELSRRQLGDTPDAAALRDRGYARFREILEHAYQRGAARSMRGAEAAFAWLRQRRVAVALNTGFYRAVTDILIERLGWRERVDAAVCVDDVPRGRPAPYMIHLAMQRCGVDSVADVAVVGDTPSDMHAGRNSGASWIIGVQSGAHPARVLRRTPLTHLIEGVWEFPSLVARLTRLT